LLKELENVSLSATAIWSMYLWKQLAKLLQLTNVRRVGRVEIL